MSNGLANVLRLGATGLLAASFATACRSEDAGVGLRGSRLSFQVPDTVRGRALTLHITATSPSALGIVGLSYSLDGSVPTLPARPIGLGGGRVNQTSDTAWVVYATEALAPGRHTITIGAFDSDGEVASVAATFESRIDTVRYHVVPLPTLGGTYAFALDINQRGVVAGATEDAASVRHAVTWTSGQLAALPDGGSGVATALNDAGLIVGMAQDPRMTRRCLRGVVWRDGGSPTMLPAYPATTLPDTSSVCITELISQTSSFEMAAALPVAVNDRGTILTERFLDQGGAVRALVSGPGNYMFGWALNNLDQAAFSVPSQVDPQGTVTAYGIGVVVGTPHDALLGIGSGLSGKRYESVGGINASGTVIGTLTQWLTRAFLSEAGGRSTDLGPITGDLRAVGINDTGDVLLETTGSTTTGVQAYRFRGGQLAIITLDASGWTLTTLRKLNNAGQIIGSAKDAGGVSHDVVLTPTP